MSEVKRLFASDVRALRHVILRPGQSVSEVTYEADEHPESGHYGVFVEGVLVAVGTVLPEHTDGKTVGGVWRIRGMAVKTEVQKSGFGAQVLLACLGHVKTRKAKLLWGNARTPVLKFYEKFGFKVVGEEFDLPGGGPHKKIELSF